MKNINFGSKRAGGGASGGGWIEYFEFNAFFVNGAFSPETANALKKHKLSA